MSVGFVIVGANNVPGTKMSRRVACCAVPDNGGLTRRELLAGLGGVVGGLLVEQGGGLPAWAEEKQGSKAPVMRTLKSGIRYVDFREGTGNEPKWGDIVSINYTTYAVEGGEKLIKVDGSEFRKAPYLFKHGGGFTVQGLEEAVHTMKVGGRRRVVVPPVFGYVGPDLGPLPDWLLARKSMKSKLRDGKLSHAKDSLFPAAFVYFPLALLTSYSSWRH
mmetsp:Transcript_41500/g.163327  ORF Transcript_41500/g.163327 Transcript_41500/m.163327 type:complete len:218 (+) Transcript_41500:200-853(+)